MNADRQQPANLRLSVWIRGLFLFVLGTCACWAQDLRTLTSPNGQIEFRAFVARPSPAVEDQLAYQVSYRGKLLLDTSFLGFEIRGQNPLGEKPGLTSSQSGSGNSYRWMTLNYLQNGSLGRLMNLEVRVYDDAVAFRYVIPKSVPLEPMLIENEDTEFRFAEDALVGGKNLSVIPEDKLLVPPFVAEEPGIGWISISEARVGAYPPMSLDRNGDLTLISTLPPTKGDPQLAFMGHTPLTTSWRILLIGPSRESISGAIPQLPE